MDLERRNIDAQLRRLRGTDTGAVRVSMDGGAAAQGTLTTTGYTEASGTVTVFRSYLLFDVTGAGLDDGRLA